MPETVELSITVRKEVSSYLESNYNCVPVYIPTQTMKKYKEREYFKIHEMFTSKIG